MMGCVAAPQRATRTARRRRRSGARSPGSRHPPSLNVWRARTRGRGRDEEGGREKKTARQQGTHTQILSPRRRRDGADWCARAGLQGGLGGAGGMGGRRAGSAMPGGGFSSPLTRRTPEFRVHVCVWALLCLCGGLAAPRAARRTCTGIANWWRCGMPSLCWDALWQSEHREGSKGRSGCVRDARCSPVCAATAGGVRRQGGGGWRADGGLTGRYRDAAHAAQGWAELHGAGRRCAPHHCRPLRSGHPTSTPTNQPCRCPLQRPRPSQTTMTSSGTRAWAPASTATLCECLVWHRTVLQRTLPNPTSNMFGHPGPTPTDPTAALRMCTKKADGRRFALKCLRSRPESRREVRVGS